MFFTKDKIKAFSIHLAVSTTIVGIVVALIFFFWYPKPYFEANGAWTVLKVLIMVDLVMGPMMTLIIYKKGKKTLVFDMSVIFAIQLAALIYGVNVIYTQRPYYLVFAVDRFEIVSLAEIDESQIKYPELELENKPSNDLILAFADFPEDVEERNKLMFEAADGKPDIERRPEYYKPYLPNVNKVMERAKTLNELIKANENNKRKVEEFLKKHDRQADGLVFFPIVGRNTDLALVVDQVTGLPLGAISADPW